MNIQRGKCSKGRFQGKFSPRIIQSPHKQSTEVNESTFEVPSLLLFSNCSCPALCNPMDCSTPGFPVLRYLPEFAQTRVYWVHDTIQPSHLLPSPSPPASIFPSIRVFSTELALHIRWQKYWSFSFRISPSSEYSGLISSRIDLFDLHASKGFQKSSLARQFKSISSSALSLLYGPTITYVHDYWKNHSFDYKDFYLQSDVSAFKYTV